MTLRPPTPTLFPYTTLFRSLLVSPPRFVPSRRAGPLRRPATRTCARRSARPRCRASANPRSRRSEEHTSELQSPDHLVCRLLLEKKQLGRALAQLATGVAHS